MGKVIPEDRIACAKAQRHRSLSFGGQKAAPVTLGTPPTGLLLSRPVVLNTT